MSVIDLIGRTPMVRLREIESYYGLSTAIYAKLEKYNPTGSAKDRAAYYMIRSAAGRGIVRDGSLVVEPTSGNMGISLAMLSAVYGYRTVIVMPEGMSAERRSLISAYGGDILLSDGDKGMVGAIEMAKSIVADVPNAYMPLQFENRFNSTAHYETMGREIYLDLPNVDILVCGVGTGGTIGGAGQYLKEKNPSLKLIAVEPLESAVLSGGNAGKHRIQGIGAGFVPPILDRSIIDRVVTVSTEGAMECCRMLIKKEGILVGISSGAALFSAISVAEERENENKNIVVILPDGGEKYLSSSGFGG